MAKFPGPSPLAQNPSLAILKNSLGDAASELPVLIADSHDEASLQALCSQTRVIISTVGPYALYGELLIKACAETGTDYADLTGEAHWIGHDERQIQPGCRGQRRAHSQLLRL